MKKFTWRLQRILDLKSKEEKILTARLNEITKNIAIAQSRVTTLRIKLKNLLDEMDNNKIHGRLTEHELLMKSTFYNDLAIKTLMAEISKMKTEKQKKTEELIQLKRYKEGMEKLRQKAKDQYMAAQQKIEQNEADDRSTVRFCRDKILVAEH